MGGSKEAHALEILPYLEAGWNAVNVSYRLGGVARAPAAVEDVRCALRWVFQHADDYDFDKSRLVLTGFSAGGHLALVAGMLPPSAGFDKLCPTGNSKPNNFYDASTHEDEMPVAAIVNWYGITDVWDQVDGDNARTYAMEWFGSQGGREELARRLSPLYYVRRDLPPIMSIHGVKDTIVPYAHALRLHEELDRVQVPNQLFTVPDGGHGAFDAETMQSIFDELWMFLGKHVATGD